MIEQNMCYKCPKEFPSNIGDAYIRINNVLLNPYLQKCFIIKDCRNETVLCLCKKHLQEIVNEMS